MQKTSLNGQPREPGAPPRAREAHAKASGPKAGNTSPRGHRHPDNPHTGTGTDSGRRRAGESKKAASGRKSRASLSRRSKQGTARPRSRKTESRDTDTTRKDAPRSRGRDTPEPEHRPRPRSRDTRGNSKQNHKKHPQRTTGEKRAGNRHRPGHPPRLSIPPRRPADKAADGAGLIFWPACIGACLGLVGGLAGGFPRPVGGRSPRSPGRGPHNLFPLGAVALPFSRLSGSDQRPPCPHFNKSGGEGGTLCPAVFAHLTGWGRGVLPTGTVATRWGLCEGSGGQCGAAFVAKHWPTGPKHRPQPAPAAAAWSRPKGRRNTA